MKGFICPITNQNIITRDIRHSSINGFDTVNYPIIIGGDIKYFKFCNSLFDKLKHIDEDFKKDFDRIRPVLLHRLINNKLKDVLHWDCEIAKGQSGNIILKDLIAEINSSSEFPKNRKQKTDNILFYIKTNQGQEGGSIKIKDDPIIWGNLFMKNIQELIFYIEELELKGLISFDRVQNNVRLTFAGLDHIETANENNKSSEGKYFEPQYDIGLSFAGEERSYVEQVAKELSKKGVKVFYDSYEQSELWGKDLYQHLNDIYRNKCKFCIVFISKNYANKLWTRHELEAAQARAFRENAEYILPVKFDDTELPGINPTTGYLSNREFTPLQIAEMAIEKLNSKH